jgi:hypothetical protein
MITEAQLMSFIDGDLQPDEADKVIMALSRDADLRALLADEMAVRRVVAASYAPVLDEAVPQRLMRPFERATSPTLEPAFFPRVRQGWRMTTALPMAASLLLGLFLGASLLAPLQPADTRNIAGLDPVVVRALDGQLVAAQSLDEEVRIGVSFVSLDGTVCRTYQSAGEGGIACRDGKSWALRLLVPVQPERIGEMQQAASSSGLIMTIVQDMISGEPMDEQAELIAKTAGWRADGNRDVR